MTTIYLIRYSEAKEKMKTYLEVGSLLKGVDTKYGKNVIKDYFKRLTIKFVNSIK